MHMNNISENALRQRRFREERKRLGLPTTEEVLRALGYAAAHSADDVMADTATQMLTTQGFAEERARHAVQGFMQARQKEPDR